MKCVVCKDESVTTEGEPLCLGCNEINMGIKKKK